jgi:hypothetical protein
VPFPSAFLRVDRQDARVTIDPTVVLATPVGQLPEHLVACKAVDGFTN